MGTVYTIASQKGGVGKTTTALNLGYALSRFGERVLLVDYDPQQGMAIASNLGKKMRFGIAQILRGTLPLSEAVAQTRDKTMGVLGAGVLAPEDAFLIEEAARDGRLCDIVRQLGEVYDTILIDPPAGVGGIVHAALQISDAVILPVSCQSAVLKSLPSILRLIQYVRERDNPALSLEGILFTLSDGSVSWGEKLRQELLESLPESLFYRTQIPRDAQFEEASVRGVPVAMLPAGSTAARPYMDLAVEVRERASQHKRAQGENDADVEGLF